MPRILTDTEIASLRAETKALPANWESRTQLKQKSHTRHTQRDFDVTGIAGHTFRVILRQSTVNLLDFSIILIHVDDDKTEYTLTRYNGKHPSQHTNRFEYAHKLQNSQFRNVFHMHHATERYQRDYGLKSIVGYAEPTTRYSSFETALEAFIADNGFQTDEDDISQLRLFDWEDLA